MNTLKLTTLSFAFGQVHFLNSSHHIHLLKNDVSESASKSLIASTAESDSKRQEYSAIQKDLAGWENMNATLINLFIFVFEGEHLSKVSEGLQGVRCCGEPVPHAADRHHSFVRSDHHRLLQLIVRLQVELSQKRH